MIRTNLRFVVHPVLYDALDDWGFDGLVTADDNGLVMLVCLSVSVVGTELTSSSGMESCTSRFVEHADLHEGDELTRLQFHRGTYTSHGSIKKGNRKSEILLRDVEVRPVLYLLLLPINFVIAYGNPCYAV